jgi:hypothetical protein
MKLLLPAHSEPCHVVTVYDGDRYVEEVGFDRKQLGDVLDVSKYCDLKEARFEHAPGDLRCEKQSYEYRAIARLDGIWYAYDVTSPTLGLPALEEACEHESCSAPTCSSEVTDPCPVDRVEEAASQDDARPTAEKADATLAPADHAKKSRNRH